MLEDFPGGSIVEFNGAVTVCESQRIVGVDWLSSHHNVVDDFNVEAIEGDRWL